MGSIQADKSSTNCAVIVVVLLSTMLIRGATADVMHAGNALILLSLASIQLTSSFTTFAGTSAVTQTSTNVEECFKWTEWMDDEYGGTLEPSSIGEFELINQLRGPYGFCNETVDIECALANDTSIPYNETGQVGLTCNLEQGFLCFHSQQGGDCFNYAIRVLCPAPCPSPTAPTSTPVPGPSLTIHTPTPVPGPSLTTPGDAMTTLNSTSVQVSAEQSTNPEVTRVPTTQSPECGEDDDTDCSAKTLTCPREFRLKCNVTISSDTNIGRCLQQNITKTSIEELWKTLNKTIPVCCFSANFTWILRSRRRRDTTSSMAIMVSDLLVDNGATVDAQTVLEVFISSINQSNVFKSYGMSYEPGTASVIEQGPESETSKPEKDSAKIAIIVCSTIACLIVVIAVALCIVYMIRSVGRRGRYTRNSLIRKIGDRIPAGGEIDLQETKQKSGDGLHDASYSNPEATA